jgi:hypothetical protein
LVELGKIIFGFTFAGLEIATAKAGEGSTLPVPNEPKANQGFQLEKTAAQY